VGVKRAALFIIIGIVCAVLAIVLVSRQLSPGPPKLSVETCSVLVALKNIDYGQPLRLANGSQDPNAGFFNEWPKSTLPEGAITSKAELGEEKMIADARFVKHQPILKTQIVPESQFVPEGMFPKKVDVDPEYISTRRFEPGMKVDVLLYDGQHFVDFMRCVKIYAVGSLDKEGRPVRHDEPEPFIYLLIKEDQERDFLKAEGAQIRLTRSTDPNCQGPVLVTSLTEKEKRQNEAQWLLDRARRLKEDGHPERAVGLLQEVVADYAEFSSLAKEAEGQLADCQREIAARLLAEARDQIQKGNFEQARKLLARPEIERDPKAAETASSLLKTVEEMAAQSQYSSLTASIDAAIQQGDPSSVGALLQELEQLVAKGVKVAAGQPAPEQMLAAYRARLKRLEDTIELDKKVLLTFLEQQKYAEARRKLREMQAKYPGYPGLEQLAQQVEAAAR